MTELFYDQARHGLAFKGRLRWDEDGVDPGKIAESVHLVSGETEVFVYGTEFEARLLGAGDREGYLGVMTASIVDAYFNPNIKTALHVRAEVTEAAKLMDVEFVSSWDQGHEIVTAAKLDLTTGIVDDVMPADDEENANVETLDREFVRIAGAFEVNIIALEHGCYLVKDMDEVRARLLRAKPAEPVDEPGM